MPENLEDRRRHFRFPAFDDDLGVKLPNENERVLFSNEELLTNEAVDTTVKKKTTTYDREDYQQEELERHRNNLPDYHASSQQRRTSINDLHQTHEFTGTTSRGVRIKRKEVTRPAYRSAERTQHPSYFKPKYVPASIIPDQQTPLFTEEELFTSMQKEKNSYLLFDTERASFDVKNNEDPTVQKFHKSAEEVAVTRKQFKKLKKDPASRQSFSRSMLNAEKETAQTPFEKKQKNASTRTGILDRSLGSIMEEESQDMLNSKYFQQD